MRTGALLILPNNEPCPPPSARASRGRSFPVRMVKKTRRKIVSSFEEGRERNALMSHARLARKIFCLSEASFLYAQIYYNYTGLLNHQFGWTSNLITRTLRIRRICGIEHLHVRERGRGEGGEGIFAVSRNLYPLQRGPSSELRRLRSIEQSRGDLGSVGSSRLGEIAPPSRQRRFRRYSSCIQTPPI